MKKHPLFLIFCLAISSHVTAASFDCSKARSKAEILICGVPELSAKDDQLAILYSQALSAANDKQEFSKKSKAEWKKREMCADVECLSSWYTSRQRQLELVVSGNSADNRSQTDRETYERAMQQMEAALKDPEKVKMLECIGVKVYEDPQPAGHPPSPEECEVINKANGIE